MRSRGGGRARRRVKAGHRAALLAIAGGLTVTTVILVYVFGGLGGGSSQPSLNVPVDVGYEKGTGPFQGLLAPDFQGRTIDGRGVTLSAFRGKVVVLWFMAAWCPSCAPVASIIKGVVGSREDVVVIVVDVWTSSVLERAGLAGDPRAPPVERPEDLRLFVERYGDPRWLLLMDEFGISSKYALRYVDTTFVISPSGVVVLRSDGPITPTLLRKALAGIS